MLLLFLISSTEDKNQAMISRRLADLERVDSLTYFEEEREKNKQTFRNALEIFKNRDAGRRRGQVEFILVRICICTSCLSSFVQFSSAIFFQAEQLYLKCFRNGKPSPKQ